MKAESKTDADTNIDVDVESEPEDNEAEECTTKGRNMALNAFYRIARNTMSMYFKNSEPSAQEVRKRKCITEDCVMVLLILIYKADKPVEKTSNWK